MIVMVVVSVLLLLLACIRLINGKPIENMFPNKPMKVDGQVHIFIGTKYNRSATINRVTADSIIIYQKLPLPLDYRGKFYATGKLNDGKRAYYLANRNYFYLVHLGEIARIIFNIVDSAYNLVPDLPDDFNETEKDIEEESEDEM